MDCPPSGHEEAAVVKRWLLVKVPLQFKVYFTGNNQNWYTDLKFSRYI